MPVLSPLKRAPSAAMAGQYVSIDLGKLQVGSKLRAPIHEDCPERDVLLLAGGTVLSESTLELLKARGIRAVRVHRSDVSRLTTPRGLAARTSKPGPEFEPDRTSAGPWATRSDSFIHTVSRHGAKRYNPALMETNATAFRKSVSAMDGFFREMAAGEVNAAPELATVATVSLEQISTDLDLFVSLGLVPVHNSYHGQHSLQTAMLAMSIGTVLGLKKEELVELGIGCLIHDAGMLRLRGSVADLPRELSPLEFLEVTKHPSITYDLLRDLRDVSVGARHVAYQMHERCDGSGYPRRRTASQIHPLAKIAAVADVFHALISPRPWRHSLLPYVAMKKIILDARLGLFDREVVRALLQTVSLFPIGSWVETSDGRVGKVIRSNGEQYTRPIVELWTPGESREAARIVNLMEAEDLQVTRPMKDVPVISRVDDSSRVPPRADAESVLVSLEDNWE